MDNYNELGSIGNGVHFGDLDFNGCLRRKEWYNNCRNGGLILNTKDKTIALRFI